ncbi:hypothetical protein CI109_104669 [Kwoniella shandongensis]|uniref:Major facilitator superfamily (MFS) profile domain-containing protein n=1 Tax=Kwoniella shandongensis TaxID=1734106 RepID=A0AAJ8LK91_9TREE
MSQVSSSSRPLGTPPFATDPVSSIPVRDELDVESNIRDVENGRKASDATVLDTSEGTAVKGHGKGLTEGDEYMPDLPKNNLKIVMPAIGLVLFLAALDQTIVSTALPTIAQDLNSSPSEYSWVGTSYLLASSLQTPINGRVSDIVGRKKMLYAAIIIFTIASALCGAAKSSTWLIIARAFQGLGGGSIIGLTSIVVSDIVPLHKRGSYQGFLGSAWGIAAVLGPIFGGLLTEKANWRWCFYINLPTCGIALFLLVITLNLNPTHNRTFSELTSTFDFLGLGLMMASSALLIVGFSRAADYGFGDTSTYGIIIAGAVVFVLVIVNCLLTKRNAVIPARLFKNRTTLAFMIGSTLHAMAFLAFNYLLPQMLQGLRGDTPLDSGIHLLPFACCVAWMTVVAGLINSRLRIIRPVTWVGYGIAALSFGLFYKYYTSTVSYATQEGLLFIAGLGVGLSLQSPLLILQAAMPLKDMAATTAAWSLTRAMGGSIGLAIFSAILNTNIRSRFTKIAGYGTVFQVPESAQGYTALHELPAGETKDQVLEAFADSFRQCWIVGCAFFLAALVLTLWTKSYSLNRARGGGVQPSPTGTPPSEPNDQLDLEAQNTTLPGTDPVSGEARSGKTSLSTLTEKTAGGDGEREGEGKSTDEKLETEPESHLRSRNAEL